MTALLSCIMIPALLRESLSLGVYVLVVTQLFNLVHFMSWNFSDITENLSENALYLDDFDRFMDLNDTTRAEGGILPSQKHINIRIEDLSFRYPGCTDYALKNVSFEFKEEVDPQTKKKSVVICCGPPMDMEVFFETEVDLLHNRVTVIVDMDLNKLDCSAYEINCW